MKMFCFEQMHSKFSTELLQKAPNSFLRSHNSSSAIIYVRMLPPKDALLTGCRKRKTPVFQCMALFVQADVGVGV
jgi:hypothetical protein